MHITAFPKIAALGAFAHMMESDNPDSIDPNARNDYEAGVPSLTPIDRQG